MDTVKELTPRGTHLTLETSIERITVGTMPIRLLNIVPF